MTRWTVAYQAPQSMDFSKQEYWSGLPFPSPRDLPDPGIKPGSPALRADALPSELSGKLSRGKFQLKKNELLRGLCMCAKLLQWRLTLCDPMDCSPPGSLSTGFFRQEYWSGLPCPPPGDLPKPGIKPRSPVPPAGGFFTD